MVGTKVSQAAEAESFLAALSPPERKLVDEMVEGWTNAKIAEQLSLSRKTVERRVSAVYEKLPLAEGADRRVQVVLFVLQARTPSVNPPDPA